jgi:hypothetical protein
VGVPIRLGAATWSGVRIGIFGDIDMDEHREWEQAVCAEVGTEAIVPLWHRPPCGGRELLDAGFVAVIVAVRDGVRPTSPLGDDRAALSRTTTRTVRRSSVDPPTSATVRAAHRDDAARLSAVAGRHGDLRNALGRSPSAGRRRVRGSSRHRV